MTNDDILAIHRNVPHRPSGAVEAGKVTDAGPEPRLNVAISRHVGRVVVRDVAAGGREIAASAYAAAVMAELGFVVRRATGYRERDGSLA